MSRKGCKSEYLPIWDATFAAYYVAQVWNDMKEGRGYRQDVGANYSDEAETVADDAVEALSRFDQVEDPHDIEESDY